MTTFLKKTNTAGTTLITVLVMTELFIIIAVGAISLAILEQKMNSSIITKDQALHVAEAGVNYYRWVLYHEHDEYCNNEACKSAPDYGPYGPYEYTDSDQGTIKGKYELYITPPPADGSTIVKIRSVGWLDKDPTKKREIEVQCGIASWSNFSALANDTIRFGEGTEVWGPIHSNFGIRFDGIAHNIVSSGVLRYQDPDHIHPGPYEYGVHTHDDAGNGTYDVDEVSDGTIPANPPDQSDVFLAGRSFPITTISFDLLNNYINDVYIKATTSGLVFDPRTSGTADPNSVPNYWGCINAGGTCDEGFHIILKNDNTFDIKGVKSLEADCSGNPSMSISSEEATTRNYQIPANGLIFVKNNVWVDGQINNSRVTILAFKEPFTGDNTDITINNDLLYTNYNGADAIALIAQNNINAGFNSENELRIDAAMIAKNGRIGRYYYQVNCGQEAKRDKLTLYGSLATSDRYGFSYSCGVSDQWCSGYDIREIIYDNNLTFSPPPHFPTTGEYTFISWKEK